ncbi:MAG TPA: hypothetical protein VFH45_13100 [Acidimicrobiales bacterium]|nr:hypothetical protein [Acidimicrobiales bacterium]
MRVESSLHAASASLAARRSSSGASASSMWGNSSPVGCSPRPRAAARRPAPTMWSTRVATS